MFLLRARAVIDEVQIFVRGRIVQGRIRNCDNRRDVDRHRLGAEIRR
jgi:hypothetical protein